MEKNFVHLHLHTEYSLLDGVGKIEEYIEKAKILKMKALAITDHGNMFGAIEMYQKALASGIKPIIGMEAYVSEFGATSKEGRIFHLVLLAQNNTGYKNLIKISSFAYTQGFYYKPRVDKEFLKNHSEGIIALSACMQGEISRRVLDRESDENIEKSINEYTAIFGKDNFYIEVQGNGIKEQKELNQKLKALAETFDLKLVATNDTHYVNKGDDTLQDILLCIQTGAKVSDEKRMKIETDELYFKSREEIIQSLGEEYIEGVNNTEEIASRCNVDIEFGKFKFPYYEIPKDFSSTSDFLKHLVYKGLEERYPFGISNEILERAEYEFSIINRMGYAEYFVVVWDFINFAKNNNIPIGPGRGSAAGSLIAYALKITELDPLKYNLIFERFLNPERISMPDIDIDICQERRQELIDYVTNKYGIDKVAQIITFGTLKARAAIRDVGRVLDVPISKVDKVAKLIPFNYSIKDSLEEIKEFRDIYQTDSQIKKIVDYSKKLENKVRHSSIHAAGIVITKDSLDETVPVYKDKDSTVATQYQMKELEDLGLLKMDFLGLRNLTNLQRTIDYIKENLKEDINLSDIPLDIKEVYQMLSEGDTLGVFQLESLGIRKLLRRLKPDKFEDIIALLALYRPGPLGSGMVDDFINCKNGISQIKYPDDSLEDILKGTYGVILYQEQVMSIANRMADYSLGEADLLRRAMGKKKFSIMNENREKFISRSMAKGYSEEIASEIFDLIYKFAGYGFNKSHSAAYALVAYWTAYFKYKYPKFYYAALMTSEMKNIDDIAIYLQDAKRHNTIIELPDVNKPASKFIVKDGKILFALSAIKNVGEKVAESIKKEWEENGDYKSFEDFVIRTKIYGVNKKTLEALIFAGALDSVLGNRNEKLLSLGKLIDYATKVSKEDEIQQMNLFGDAKSTINSFTLANAPDFSLEEKLEKEKEVLGFYFSGHPLDKYINLINSFEYTPTNLVKNEQEGKDIQLFGILRNIKKIVTKNSGEIMCVFEIEDFTGIVSCIAFPRTFTNFQNEFLEGNKVYIQGSIQVDYFNGNENKKVIVRNISSIETVLKRRSLTTYILLQEKDKDKFSHLINILKKHSGESLVYFALKTETRKEVKLSKYKITPDIYFVDKITKLLGENCLKFK